jgi:hypothetical protein
MGEILARLTPDQLKACQLSLKLIDDKAMELGLVKRGHQHLWNELATRHGVVGKKIEIDYTTGLIMERAEVEKPKEEQPDG